MYDSWCEYISLSMKCCRACFCSTGMHINMPKPVCILWPCISDSQWYLVHSEYWPTPYIFCVSFFVVVQIYSFYIYRFYVCTIFEYRAYSASKLSDFIHNSINFDRFLTLIACLCFAIKRQSNKQTVSSFCEWYISGFYEELVMSPFPHREFGFSTAEDFILQHMSDVARIKMFVTWAYDVIM